MCKKASNKQLNYLKYILASENISLCTLTDKPLDDLLHQDMTEIFKKLDTPITAILNNYIYRIDFENKDLNYIIGTQINIKKKTQMKLICFKELMMIDWDTPKNMTKESLFEEIKTNLSKFPYTFHIYETHNGYHGYLMSKEMWFSDWRTIKLLKNLKCDEFYIGFTRKVGFVVRLNKKSERQEKYIEKFVCQINNYPVLDKFKKLLNIKDSLIKSSYVSE